jgi:hypothetical protein
MRQRIKEETAEDYILIITAEIRAHERSFKRKTPRTLPNCVKPAVLSDLGKRKQAPLIRIGENQQR